MQTATLDGYVMAYRGNETIRSLSPGWVNLHVVAAGRVLNPLNPKDFDVIKAHHRDIESAVYRHRNGFAATWVNQEGYFRIQDVPIGHWGYVVVAQIEDRAYPHTAHRLGNNGFGDNGLILAADLARAGGRTPEKIIIPVYDKWLPQHEPFDESLYGPEPEIDPENLEPGLRKEWERRVTEIMCDHNLSKADAEKSAYWEIVHREQIKNKPPGYR